MVTPSGWHLSNTTSKTTNTFYEYGVLAILNGGILENLSILKLIKVLSVHYMHARFCVVVVSLPIIVAWASIQGQKSTGIKLGWTLTKRGCNSFHNTVKTTHNRQSWSLGRYAARMALPMGRLYPLEWGDEANTMVEYTRLPQGLRPSILISKYLQ